MYSTKEDSECTVIIDEVENHLHPTMQRQVLSDLVEAFPNARFIVSTHSPLVVGSVKDSSVYVLEYNDSKKIIGQALDFANKARTAAEILDEVLGVSFTMPLWVEDEYNRIIDKYTKEERLRNKNDFLQMRHELANCGLDKLLPQMIVDTIGEVQ